jgi:hypothetical protein
MRILAIVVLAMLVSTAAMAAGGPDFTTNYPTATGHIDQWGVWKLEAGTWNLYQPAGNLLRNNVEVTADVEIWEHDTLGADKVDFHFGRTGTDALVAMPISAVVSGTVQSNNNCTVDIWAASPCPSLRYLKYESSAFGDAGTNIPLTWEYSLAADSGFLPCTFPNGDAKAVAFPDGFGTNAVDKTFYIRLTATPDALQADGHYKLDPVISVTPTL